MTETLSTHPTHLATLDDRIDSVNRQSTHDDTQVNLDGQVKGDEDGTIKCICSFADDDGKTVLCEPCGTWQHQDCYYHNDSGVLPDFDNIEHHCIDCKPRHLDHRGAHERQRSKREIPGLEEAKIKKPSASKSNKRKMKLSDVGLTNGWSHERNDSHVFPDRDSRSPKEHLSSTKRPKTNHRPVSSTSIPSSHSHGSNNKRTQKAGSNGFVSPAFSDEFLELFERDPGDTPMQANLFSNISITSSLSEWSHDVEALSTATNGRQPHEVFEQCDRPVDQMPLPPLQKQHHEIKSLTNGGRTVKMTYLTTTQPVHKMSPIGELRGKIGFMKDYCDDPSNRWDHLRHPLPFVFFHQHLPICIDTRNEGTQCRYLRRSCNPNLTLKTFLEGQDYHFCFVAKDDLDAGSELTIGWTLDAHMRRFVAQKGSQDSRTDDGIDQDESYAADWVEKVLTAFGGCACSSPDHCSLARYARFRKPNGPDHSVGGLGRLKQRKSHKKQMMSEPAYGSTSRASSEGMKATEDDLVDGNLSTSDSTRSKPRSRDLTPTLRQPADSKSAPGLEISEREKRKIAAIEKSDQMEHERQQPTQKRKKRNSDNMKHANGTTPLAKSVGVGSISQPNTPGLIVKPFYEEVGTGTSSGSPVAKSSFAGPGSRLPNRKRASLSNNHINAHSSPRPQSYVDSGTQTDRDNGTHWIKAPMVSRPARKTYVSLTKRLLRRCQQERIEQEKQRVDAQASVVPHLAASHQGPDGDDIRNATQALSNGVQTLPVSAVRRADLESLSTSPSLSVLKPRPPGNLENHLATLTTNALGSGSHLNSQVETVNGLPTRSITNGDHRPPLHLEPPEHTSASSAPPAHASPTLATPGTALPNTPLFHHAASDQSVPEYSPTVSSPSLPKTAKKKVSLSEYMKRKTDKAEADHQACTAESRSSASPTLQHHILGRALGNVSEEPKVDVVVGGDLVATPSYELANGTSDKVGTNAPPNGETGGILIGSADQPAAAED